MLIGLSGKPLNVFYSAGGKMPAKQCQKTGAVALAVGWLTSSLSS